MSDYRLKQAIIVRNDLKLPKGKLASQAAHASVEAVLKGDKELIREWRNEGMPKIVLKIDDEKSILRLNQMAKDFGIITALITDAGKTVVEPGTITCLALGPEKNDKLDKIIKDLKLL